ncbi:MAG: hypothetical protein MUP57_05880 [Clostridia bacterium]|nr:hypothetical protein [Clostridia bacterium]
MFKKWGILTVLIAFLFSTSLFGSSAKALTEPVVENNIETIARQGEKDRLPGSLKFASITLQTAGVDFFKDQPEGLKALDASGQDSVAVQPAEVNPPEEETTTEQTTETTGTVTTTETAGPGGNTTTVIIEGDGSDVWYDLN